MKVYDIHISSYEPGQVYLGSENNGLYVSQNNGRDWRAENSGLPPNATIRDIFESPQYIFSIVTEPTDERNGSFHSTIYRSDRKEIHWVQVGQTIDHLVNVGVAGEDNLIYLGTEEGLYFMEGPRAF